MNDSRRASVVRTSPNTWRFFQMEPAARDALEARALALVRTQQVRVGADLRSASPSDWALIEITGRHGVCGTDLALVDGRHSRGPDRLSPWPRTVWPSNRRWLRRATPTSSVGVVGENVLPARPRHRWKWASLSCQAGSAAPFPGPRPAAPPSCPDRRRDAIDAAIAEPLAVVGHLIERLRPGQAPRALIFGDGPIGLLAARLLRVNHQAEVTVVGRDADRLRIAQAEADAAVAEWPFPRHNGDSWDVVIEASGDPLAAQLGAQHCRDGGVVALAGAYAADGHVSLRQLTQHNLRVEGVNAGHGGWATALKNLADRTISSRLLQPAIVGVEDAPTRIIEMLESTKRPLKLILTHPGRPCSTTDARPPGGKSG